ncbi:MAG TPA: HNH endonuclease signature motif containing protein [Bacteriovoracaceae bacterium]|nr:HNH endonuclease signature motif containing protein [Bacteriovoracaceae bacterium]
MPKRRLRYEMWQKNPICFVCKCSIKEFYQCSFEHVVPLSLGGRNSKWNLAISHVSCNNRRGNIRCPLVLETFPFLRIENIPYIKQIKKRTCRGWAPGEQDQFSELVQAWKTKLEQQELAYRAQKKQWKTPPIEMLSPEKIEFKKRVQVWRVKLRKQYIESIAEGRNERGTK